MGKFTKLSVSQAPLLKKAVHPTSEGAVGLTEVTAKRCGQGRAWAQCVLPGCQLTASGPGASSAHISDAAPWVS